MIQQNRKYINHLTFVFLCGGYALCLKDFSIVCLSKKFMGICSSGARLNCCFSSSTEMLDFAWAFVSTGPRENI